MKKLQKYKHLFMFLPFLSLAFPPFLHFQENITSQLGPVSTQVKVRMQDIKSMDKPSELLIPGSGILRDNGPRLVRRELYHLWEIIKWLIKSPRLKEGDEDLAWPSWAKAGLLVFPFPQSCPWSHQDCSQLKWPTLFLYQLQRKMLSFQRTKRTATGCKWTANFRTF